MSQPLHLRHLSIIRDTILKGKGSIFNYYSYESFKKLVERGVGFWEAVVTVPDDQTTGRTFAASLDEVPELDDFGFPMIDPNLFLGPDNNANPEECASVLNADVFHIQSNSPVLQRHSDGTNGNILKLVVLLHVLTGFKVSKVSTRTQHRESRRFLRSIGSSLLRSRQNLACLNI